MNKRSSRNAHSPNSRVAGCPTHHFGYPIHRGLIAMGGVRPTPPTLPSLQILQHPFPQHLVRPRYAWPSSLTDAQVLERSRALNHGRVAWQGQQGTGRLAHSRPRSCSTSPHRTEAHRSMRSESKPPSHSDTSLRSCLRWITRAFPHRGDVAVDFQYHVYSSTLKPRPPSVHRATSIQ